MTDIRKGDLVRAIHKELEVVIEGRVSFLNPSIFGVEKTGTHCRSSWDIEVLDRPVDEELLVGAIEAYRKSAEFTTPWGEVDGHVQNRHRKHLTAVIEFINEYNAKEKK